MATALTCGQPADGGQRDDRGRIEPQGPDGVRELGSARPDWNGMKRVPTITAPAIATGVPKPDVPSMIAPERERDQNALQAPVEGDVDDRFLDDLELAGGHCHRVKGTSPQARSR